MYTASSTARRPGNKRVVSTIVKRTYDISLPGHGAVKPNKCVKYCTCTACIPVLNNQQRPSKFYVTKTQQVSCNKDPASFM